jgi:hypothetical protein
MPNANRYWTCEVCGQVLPNAPKPVLSHVMAHAQRRPFATSAAPAAGADIAHDDEAAS